MSYIVIAAGGSGGHIFPGVSLADALRAQKPSTEIMFWGNKHGMESRIIPKHGYSLKKISIGRLNHNVSKIERVKTIFQLPLAFIAALFFLLKKRPRLVIGMGGHASAPLLLAASLLRVKTYLWEPNAYPGLANRYLSKVVDVCLTVFDQAKAYFPKHKCQKAGVLVRSDIDQLYAQAKSFDSEAPLKLFIFGGSNGARGVNNIIRDTFKAHPELLKNIKVFQQTGSHDFKKVEQEYKELNLDIEISPFVDDMKAKYLWADFAIIRGGINSITEVAAAGLPCFVIPLPTASNDHQAKNGQALVDLDAAYMARQGDLNVNELASLLGDLAGDKQKLIQKSQNIKQFYRVGYAQELAEELLKD